MTSMKIGIQTWGTEGDVRPFIALAAGLGTNGIWIGINVSDIFQGLAMMWYFKRGYWQKRYYKHRDILENETAIALNG